LWIIIVHMFMLLYIFLSDQVFSSNQ
jgi:hypothetical protein